VIEDDFPAGRPPFDAAGVELVDDVAPYEAMKLRCANCTHQAICYFGTLLGYRLRARGTGGSAHPRSRAPILERGGAAVQQERPTAFIENRELFGDLVDDPRFRNPYLATLEALRRGGVDEALRQLTND